MNEQLRERCRYKRPLEDAPTRHIILRGRESDLLDLRETLYCHGAVKVTSPEPSRGYHCFASFDSITDAKACLESISKQNQSSISVKYADIEDADEKKENEKEKDQRNGGLHAAYLTAQDCDIPGLELIPDFVTEEEETALLTEVDSLPWNQLARRRVQHYGKVFDYTVRHVSESVEARPMPPKVADLLRHKISDLIPLTTEAQPFDQLTVNEYPCGVGLSPHIDTHSAFGDVIISLSLASHAVMTFRCNGQQRTLFLPPRSLLIMAGECRFAWEHYIPHRKMDSVVTPGDVPKVVRRGERRISFTFRHTRKNPCSCPFPKICDSQDGFIPPTRNGSEALLSDMDGCQGGRKVTRPGNPKAELETTNVHEVYDAIASHFSATRFAVWPAVKTFLEELPKGAIVADVGCGNGKYFGVRNDIFTTGSDRSTGLAAVAAKRTRERLIGSRNVHLKADVLVSDGLHLPYRDRSCNAVICIAVLHHLSSVSRRLQLLNELTRILAPNGMALVTVWATRQENMGKIAKWKQLDAVSKTIEGGNSAGFDEGTYGENDYLVPWHVPLNRAEAAATAAATVKASGAETTPRSSTAGGVVDLKKNTVVFQRYYHLFEADELQGLVQRVPGVDLIKLFYDKDNWCVVFRRQAE